MKGNEWAGSNNIKRGIMKRRKEEERKEKERREDK